MLLRGLVKINFDLNNFFRKQSETLYKITYVQ